MKFDTIIIIMPEILLNWKIKFSGWLLPLLECIVQRDSAMPIEDKDRHVPPEEHNWLWLKLHCNLQCRNLLKKTLQVFRYIVFLRREDETLQVIV